MSHFTEKNFRFLFNAMDDAVFLLGMDDVVCDCNHAAIALTGFCRSEIIGRHFRSFCAERDIHALERGLFVTLRGRRANIRATIKQKHGSGFTARVSIHRIPSEDVKPTVIRCVIVSRQHGQISTTEQMDNAMLQIGEIAALGQLVPEITHEFSNVMLVITNNLDILDRLVPHKSRQDHLVKGCKRATGRATALITQTLELLAGKNMAPMAYDVNQAIQSCRDLIKKACGSQTRLSIHPASSPAIAFIHLSGFKIALLHVVTNAREAMPLGGEVTISVAASDPVLKSKCAEYVVVSVTDSGVGMSSETRERATDPFFSTKPGRLGIGITQARRFVENFGGKMRIITRPVRGTKIELYLPVASQRPEESQHGSLTGSRRIGLETAE